MTITSEIIKDSISPNGIRITTFQLRYPRFIHAEELTHRLLETSPEMLIYEAVADGLMYDPDLSRNASSSRAIPIKRMIEDIRRDPAMPVYWGGNKPGMQAGAELVGQDLDYVQHLWLEAMEKMISTATLMNDAGLHKQIANRILEPWAHINVVVTATSFANFFALRCHKDAQPEIKELAEQMQRQMGWMEPDLLQPGQWHLPYITGQDIQSAKDRITANGTLRVVPSEEQINAQLLRVSTARCARVSYMTHEGRETTFAEDSDLFDRLVVSTPLHASPAEHQATPDTGVFSRGGFLGWSNPHQHGNFNGWIQHRKTLPGEFTPG